MRTKRLKGPTAVSDSALLRFTALSHDGTAWNDLTPHANMGTDNTGGGWPLFDGVGDHVIVPSPYVVTGGGPGSMPLAADLTAVTVEVWINPAAIGAHRRALSINSDTDLNYLSLGLRDVGYMFLQVRNAIRCTGLTTLVAGAWTHVVATVASGTAPIMYVNGLDDTDTSTSSTYVAENIQVSVGGTLYGALPSVSQAFHGDIDTARIYSRILSPDEVLMNYNAGRAAHP
jgi:hypothetical protein